MVYQITAPTPGIFWHRPDPDSPPFAAPGDRVEPNSVIGVIEVMKMFMDVEAGASGVFDGYVTAHGGVVSMGAVLAGISVEP